MLLPTASGESFAIRVKPGADRTEVTGYDTARNAFTMTVAASPEKGKANAEIIRFFKREYGLAVEIRTGHTSKSKLLRVL